MALVSIHKTAIEHRKKLLGPGQMMRLGMAVAGAMAKALAALQLGAVPARVGAAVWLGAVPARANVALGRSDGRGRSWCCS
jgi:hypothetical protein